MLRSPAGERNKQPILEVLQKYISTEDSYKLMEISSGCGLHVSFLAKYFPKINFQPSEYETKMFTSIIEYSKDHKNINEPVFVDISKDIYLWESKYQNRLLKDSKEVFDFMLNINMIHITPLSCTIGLFKNCSVLLKPNGLLFTYGPYSYNNILTPESNVYFNQNLKQQNSSWGIRDIIDVKKIAQSNFIELLETHEMPANNKILVWKKVK